MLQYVARRLLQGVLVLFATITVVFWVFVLVPGDPAQLYAGEDAPQDYVERLRRDFGLDEPPLKRYFDFISGLPHGDLGSSFFSTKPVLEEVLPRTFNTLQLALVAIIIAVLFGGSVGIVTAVRQGSLLDRSATVVVVLGIALPTFWVGLMLMYLLGVKWRLLPIAGKGGWRYFVMPAVTISLFPATFIARMTRASFLEVLRQDYIVTARAKGLPEQVIWMRHALLNALPPILTIIGLRLGYMLGGSVIVETIFAWPGMGRLLINSILSRDFPMIRGILLVFSGMFVVLNLLVDLLTVYFDPRARTN